MLDSAYTRLYLEYMNSTPSRDELRRRTYYMHLAAVGSTEVAILNRMGRLVSKVVRFENRLYACAVDQTSGRWDFSVQACDGIEQGVLMLMGREWGTRAVCPLS